MDDKKIEETARRYSKVTDCDKEVSLLVQEGFTEGAKWAIEEFLKGLWHDAKEVPTQKDQYILEYFESYSTGTECDYDKYFGLSYTSKDGFTDDTWIESTNNDGVPSCWLYINDLLPNQKGGEQ